MLRIGYVAGAGEAQAGEVASLRALGCHVVRVESRDSFKPLVLAGILDFIGADDHLVVTRLNSLGSSAAAVLTVLERLQERRAVLVVAEPEVTNQGVSGRALRAVLEMAAGVEALSGAPRRRIHSDEVLELRREGLGPAEIARRLGVSRMTVWRKLKAEELQNC